MLMVSHWHGLELCLDVGFIFGRILRVESIAIDIQGYNMKNLLLVITALLSMPVVAASINPLLYSADSEIENVCGWGMPENPQCRALQNKQKGLHADSLPLAKATVKVPGLYEIMQKSEKTTAKAQKRIAELRRKSDDYCAKHCSNDAWEMHMLNNSLMDAQVK